MITSRQEYVYYPHNLEENYNLIDIKEAIYSIQEDVDMIYNYYFQPITFNLFSNKNIEKPIFNKKFIDLAKELNVITEPEDILLGVLYSDKLKSKDCIDAHSKLPVFIFLGIFKKGSYHQFKTKSAFPPFCVISLNQSAVNIINKYELSKIKNSLRGEITGALSESTVKGVIAHELTHWIDDAKYNIFDNILDGGSSKEEKEIKILLHKEDVNLTYFEIQSQIHSIVQLKEYYIDEWDSLTLLELLRLVPSLYLIAKIVIRDYEIKVFKLWLKSLIKRMNRENLLGKNMRNLNIKELEKEVEMEKHRVY